MLRCAQHDRDCAVYAERSERAQHDRECARVTHTLSFMCAPYEHAEHLCHCVPPMACLGFLTATDIKGPPRRIGATPAQRDS
jgi:hypothetical protein